MKDGIESESSIIQTFEHETGNKVLKSGFFISDTHPFLGASPDGLVDEDKIVEVKKIVLKEGESLEDGMCRLGIYKRFEQQLRSSQQQSQVLLPNTATAVLCEAIHLLFYCFKCKRNPQRHCSV